MPGDYYDVCPKCGNTKLETHQASTAMSTMIDITQKLKDLLR